MKKIAFLIVVLLLANASVPAQSRKFIWSDEICTFEGTYNGALYTEKQLENTHQLYDSPDFEMDISQAAAFSPEGIEKLRTVASLDEEYARKSATLKNLEIVDVPFWKAFRQKKLKMLEQKYKLARASVQAYEKPSALKEVTFADACVQRFAPPLIAGGDSLLGVWLEIYTDLRKKNADPEGVRKNFEEKLASADKFRYAQVEVITYGWWNCVNDLIEGGDETIEIYKNFRKLFRRVKQIGCDYAWKT